MTVIAVALLAAVFGVEMILRGVPEFGRDIEILLGKPMLTARSRSNVRVGDATSYPIVGKL